MDEIEIMEQDIRNLRSKLESSVSDIGDWKVVKCYEATLKGLPSPYDIDDLLHRRQLVRDEINSIQDKIASVKT